MTQRDRPLDAGLLTLGMLAVVVSCALVVLCLGWALS